MTYDNYKAWTLNEMTGTWTALGIIDKARHMFPLSRDFIDNQDVILDHIRAIIMEHCGLKYPKYALAPWHRVAKYLAKSDKSLSMDLDLIDPDFDDTF